MPLATHVLIHNEEEDEEISHDGEEDVDGDDEGGHTLKFSCSWITCLQFHPIFSSSILLAGYSDGWIQVMHITKQTTSLSAQVIAKISNVVPGLSSRVKRLEWYPSVKKQQHDATEKDEDQQKEQQQHQETSTSSSPPRTHHQDVFLVVTDEEVSLFRVHSLNNISSTYMACIYRHFVHATRIIDAVWHPHVEEDCCAGMVASLSAKARGSSSRGGRNASLHGKSSE